MGSCREEEIVVAGVSGGDGGELENIASRSEIWRGSSRRRAPMRAWAVGKKAALVVREARLFGCNW